MTVSAKNNGNMQNYIDLYAGEYNFWVRVYVDGEYYEDMYIPVVNNFEKG